MGDLMGFNVIFIWLFLIGTHVCLGMEGPQTVQMPAIATFKTTDGCTVTAPAGVLSFLGIIEKMVKDGFGQDETDIPVEHASKDFIPFIQRLSEFNALISKGGGGAEALAEARKKYFTMLRSFDVEHNLTTFLLSHFYDCRALGNLLWRQLGTGQREKMIEILYKNSGAIKRLPQDIRSNLKAKLFDDVQLPSARTIAEWGFSLQQVAINSEGTHCIRLAGDSLCFISLANLPEITKKEMSNYKVKFVRFSPQGSHFFFVNDRHKLFKSTNDFRVRKLGNVSSQVTDLVSSANGRYCFVISTLEAESVLIGMHSSLKQLRFQNVKMVHFNPINNTQLVMVTSHDGEDKVEVKSFEPNLTTVKTIKFWEGFRGAQFMPNGRDIALIDDKHLAIGSLETNEVATVGEHVGSIHFLAVSPLGKIVTAADKHIKIWALTLEGNLIGEFSIDGYPTAVDFSSNEDHIAVIDDQNRTYMFSVLSLAPLYVAPVPGWIELGINILCSSGDPVALRTQLNKVKGSKISFTKSGNLIVAKNTGELSLYDNIFLANKVKNLKEAILVKYALQFSAHKPLKLDAEKTQLFHKLPEDVRVLIKNRVEIAQPFSQESGSASL